MTPDQLTWCRPLGHWVRRPPIATPTTRLGACRCYPFWAPESGKCHPPSSSRWSPCAHLGDKTPTYHPVGQSTSLENAGFFPLVFPSFKKIRIRQKKSLHGNFPLSRHDSFPGWSPPPTPGVFVSIGPFVPHKSQINIRHPSLEVTREAQDMPIKGIPSRKLLELDIFSCLRIIKSS